MKYVSQDNLPEMDEQEEILQLERWEDELMSTGSESTTFSGRRSEQKRQKN